MSFSTVRLPDLVIPNGATDSNVKRADTEYGFGYEVGIVSPVAGTILVSNDNVTFGTLQLNGADVALVANKAVVVKIPFMFFKVKAGAAVGAATNVQVSIHDLL